MNDTLSLLSAQLKKQYLPNTLATKDLYIGQRKYSVEIPYNQNVGLSFRPEMERDKGMLFIVSPEGQRLNQPPKFHMNNMNFSLDFICINEQNIVVHIERNIEPYENMIVNLPTCIAVLEVNAGDSEGLNIGDMVHNISDFSLNKQDGGGGGDGGGEGGAGFFSSEDAGTTTFSATGSRKKVGVKKDLKKSLDVFISKQIAYTNLGQGVGEFSTSPNIPKKSGHRGESDKVREMSERGFLNRAIQDGMTEEEWARKQDKRTSKFERIKELYERAGNKSKIKRLENYLHGDDRKDPELYVRKSFEGLLICDNCPEYCNCVFLNGCACEHDCLCSNFIRGNQEDARIDLSDILIKIEDVCPLS